jgi:DNA-binding response OmpR family regulator
MNSTRKKSDLARLRVMVVDDDKLFLSEVDEVLSLSGYETTAFDNGKAALKWARAERPDVIILDIKMDGMNGFQLTKNLKRCSETVGIPVIAMTGHFTREEHSAIMQECGIETCLKKPFNALNMLRQIEMALGIRARGEVKGAENALRAESAPGAAQAAAASTP